MYRNMQATPSGSSKSPTTSTTTTTTTTTTLITTTNTTTTGTIKTRTIVDDKSILRKNNSITAATTTTTTTTRTRTPSPPPIINNQKLISDPNSEIEELSKKISEHAEALYRNWKSRGVAPTELFEIYSGTASSTGGLGTASGSSLQTTTNSTGSPVSDFFMSTSKVVGGDDATTTAEGLQKLVNSFVIKDKEQRAVKAKTINNNNNAKSSIIDLATTTKTTMTSTTPKSSGGASTKEHQQQSKAAIKKSSSSPVTLKHSDVGGGKAINNTTTSDNVLVAMDALKKSTRTPTLRSSSPSSSPPTLLSSVSSSLSSSQSASPASSTSSSSSSSSPTTSRTSPNSKSNNACVKNGEKNQKETKKSPLNDSTPIYAQNFDQTKSTTSAGNIVANTINAATVVHGPTGIDVGTIGSIANIANIANIGSIGLGVTSASSNMPKAKKSPGSTSAVEIPSVDINLNLDLNADLKMDVTNLSQLQTQNLLKIKELLQENADPRPKATTKKTHSMKHTQLKEEMQPTLIATTTIPTPIATAIVSKTNKSSATLSKQSSSKAANSSSTTSSLLINENSANKKIIKLNNNTSNNKPSIDVVDKIENAIISIADKRNVTNISSGVVNSLNSVSGIGNSGALVSKTNANTSASAGQQQKSIEKQSQQAGNGNAIGISKSNRRDDDKSVKSAAPKLIKSSAAKEGNSNSNSNSKTATTTIPIISTNSGTTSPPTNSPITVNTINRTTNSSISTIATTNTNSSTGSASSSGNKSIGKDKPDKKDTRPGITNTADIGTPSSDQLVMDAARSMPAPTKIIKSGRPMLNGQDKNLIRPGNILTRGSVAQRVLMFEKCPDARNSFLNIKRPDPADAPPKSLLKAKLHSTPPPPPDHTSLQREIRSTKSVYIPRFYFPHGKPQPQIALERTLRGILSAFDSFPNNQVTKDELPRILKLCGLPFYWRMPVMVFCQQGNSGLVERQRFVEFWKQMNVYCHDAASRFVYILSRGQRFRSYIMPEDMAPLVQDVVDTHPGLAFLKEASEFHSRYVHTVIARIFYSVNRCWSGKITISELKKSDLLEIITLLEEEDDINQIMAFFSYEHFYVIYCKFWELDKDHDLLINQDDLARHSDHALSTRIVERIFSGCVTRSDNKKNSDDEPKMSYTDFVWFLLSEEDKRTPTAIEYWFRCMDIDGDGVLSMYELEYFYEEQQQRMESIGIETLPFEDCLCQMLDMIKPQQHDCIALGDLKRCKMTHVFFDTFFNLEKYLDHEQRDPFASQRDEYSSDWDRFAAQEYELLITEENE